MSKDIMVSQEAVDSLLKTSREIEEEMRARIHNIERTLNSAESLGWTDIRFNEIKEDFKDIVYKLNEMLIKNEDIIMPKLRKISQNIENY